MDAITGRGVKSPQPVIHLKKTFTREAPRLPPGPQAPRQELKEVPLFYRRFLETQASSALATTALWTL